MSLSFGQAMILWIPQCISNPWIKFWRPEPHTVSTLRPHRTVKPKVPSNPPFTQDLGIKTRSVIGSRNGTTGPPGVTGPTGEVGPTGKTDLIEPTYEVKPHKVRKAQTALPKQSYRAHNPKLQRQSRVREVRIKAPRQRK